MKVEILAVHKHDAWASDSRALLGQTGTANWVNKTPGIPGWSGMDLTLDNPNITPSTSDSNGNVIFFAVKYKEIPDEA